MTDKIHIIDNDIWERLSSEVQHILKENGCIPNKVFSVGRKIEIKAKNDI